MKMNKNLAIVAVAMLPAFAHAQEGAAAAASNGAEAARFWAAGICIGLAAAVVGFSQSRAAVSALDGIGRNPAASKELFTPLILSFALMESLVLLAFVIAAKLAGIF